MLLAYFFVTTGVAAFLAQKVLTGFGGKENLMLAVTIGVVAPRSCPDPGHRADAPKWR